MQMLPACVCCHVCVSANPFDIQPQELWGFFLPDVRRTCRRSVFYVLRMSFGSS